MTPSPSVSRCSCLIKYLFFKRKYIFCFEYIFNSLIKKKSLIQNKSILFTIRIKKKAKIFILCLRYILPLFCGLTLRNMILRFIHCFSIESIIMCISFTWKSMKTLVYQLSSYLQDMIWEGWMRWKIQSNFLATRSRHLHFLIDFLWLSWKLYRLRLGVVRYLRNKHLLFWRIWENLWDYLLRTFLW